MEVEMKIRGLMVDPSTNMPIILLKDAQSEAVLPIWVGLYEAQAIALEVEKSQTPRPLTHDLLKNLIHGLNAKVQRIVVTELKDDTFYAVIWMEQNGEIVALDCASIRRTGPGAAYRLPDLRRRRRSARRQGSPQSRRASLIAGCAQVARKPQRRGLGPIQDVAESRTNLRVSPLVHRTLLPQCPSVTKFSRGDRGNDTISLDLHPLYHDGRYLSCVAHVRPATWQT